MNKLQAYIILGSIWMFVISFFIFILYWFKKNNMLIQQTEFENNVFLYKSIRCREKDKMLYGFNDFFSKRPIGIKKEEYKDFIIKSEGLPFFGTSFILNVKKHKGKYYPYLIDHEEFTDVYVDDDMVAWVNEARIDLYKATELKESTKEQVLKLVVPAGLILLAIACLIFFPKMYETVMETGNTVAKSAISDFTGALNQFIPKG